MPGAETAYLISGHGFENLQSNKVRVPKGCSVVVDVHSGDTSLISSVVHKSNHFFYTSLLDSESPVYGYEFDKNVTGKEVILNPEEHYDILAAYTSESGSLAIYKEDELCPNFFFTLFDILKTDSINLIRQVGVKQYPFRDPVDLVGVYTTADKPSSKSESDKVAFKSEYGSVTDTYSEGLSKNIPVEYFLEFYTNSVYPSQKDVAMLIQIYKTYFGESNTLMDFMEFIDDALNGYVNPTLSKKLEEYIKQHSTKEEISNSSIMSKKLLDSKQTLVDTVNQVCTVDLDTLFKLVKKGILNPGIIYNYICRTTSGHISAKVSKDKGNRVLNDFKSLGYGLGLKPKFFIKELMNQISEAEIQRKRQIPKLFKASTKKLKNVQDTIESLCEELSVETNAKAIAELQKEMREAKMLQEALLYKNRNTGKTWKKNRTGKWKENLRNTSRKNKSS